ncbi:NYN domain-containing protein [Patescibacteria group bacterium]|nr:NYN domain-containing protein [Patescibacteria group bacterium]MBU2633605.1 NYN domain-containing protein [Patescibacteria group bacterium]
MDINENFSFELKGNTLVCIDWANVYGWQKKLKWRIDVHKLISYLETYPEIKKINFYFGTDINKESKDFIDSVKKLENGILQVVTKDVKYIPVDIIDSDASDENESKKKRRKCDFDIEIALDTFLNIESIKSFILFSGDGDYEPLIKFCIERGKQAIIVANPGSLGKEYGLIPRGLFVCNIKKIKDLIEK